MRTQLEETDHQLEEAERRAKVVVARAFNGGNSDGGGGGILRAEEGLFHDLQAARDELSALKAVRRELEGQVCLRVFWDGGGTKSSRNPQPNRSHVYEQATGWI